VVSAFCLDPDRFLKEGIDAHGPGKQCITR
jgi:hypothetical protein